MPEKTPFDINETANTPSRYGIYGYELKKSIMKTGRPVEFRAVIKTRKNAEADATSSHRVLQDTEVLISNQGTIAGEPKIIDGVHKRQIADELMVFMQEEDFGKLRIDLTNMPLYADGGENPIQIDEEIRREISERVAELIESLSQPPPPPSRRKLGRY